MTTVDEILSEMEPLFDEARRNGKWFWCRYQDLWFSPDQLAAQHANGKFIWSAVNWQLRDPIERLKEAQDRASKAQNEVDRIAADIAAEFARSAS